MGKLGYVMEGVHQVQQLSRTGDKRPYIPWLALLGGLALAGGLGAVAPLYPLSAILGGCVILLLALVEPRPLLIVLGLALLLPLTGGLARGAVVPVLRIGQALVVLGFSLCMLAKSGPQGKFRFTAIDLAFILYLLAGAVFPLLALYYRGDHLNLFSNDAVTGKSPAQVLLGPVQYYLLYRIVVAIVSSEKQIETVLKLTFIASIIVSIIGILEELHVGPVLSFLQTYYPIPEDIIDYNAANLRIASTLLHYSGLGAYLAFTLILALCCYIGRAKISPLLLGATMLLDSIALVLTLTFAAWTGLAVGIIVVLLIFRRFPKALVLSLIGIALALLFFQSVVTTRLGEQLGKDGAFQGILPQSFAYRVMLWQIYALPAIKEQLVFGWGPAPALLANGFFVEESQYFHLLLEGGVVYFLSYIVLIGVATAVCWREIKKKSGDVSYIVAIATLAMLVSINVMNVSGEYFTYVGGPQTLWMLLAIVVASRQLKALEPAVATGKSRFLACFPLERR